MLGPADRNERSVQEFETGDCAGDDAAPSVEVGRTAVLGKRRAVGVTADNNLVVLPHPIRDSLLKLAHLWLTLIPLYRQVAQAVPKSRRPAGQEVQAVVDDIGLMTVDSEQLLAGLLMLQHQSLVGQEPVLEDLVVRFVLEIVVAKDEMESLVQVHMMKQIEDPPVSLSDLSERPALPELIPVAHLDVSEATALVEGKCVQEEPGVGEE